MEYFTPVGLSTSLLPLPLDEEVDIRSIDEVSVHIQNDKVVCGDLFKNGKLILTNFRVIIITESSNSSPSGITTGWGFHLKDVSHLEDCSTFFSKSKRLKVNFKQRKVPHDVGLKFHSGDKEEFLDVFSKVHAKKSWEKVISKSTIVPQPFEKKAEESFSVTHAGIGGIIRRQEKTLQSVDMLAKSAMTDLDALIDQAREVVMVVQRYAAYIQDSRQIKENGDELSETSTQIAEASEMESIMQSIGIISPVTRLSAGRLFHEQLARQIADLMQEHCRLQRLGGMITLTDLYCIYNKARGTELVSPNDLLGACEKLRGLNLGIHLRIFPSGVKVVVLDGFDDHTFLRNVTDFIESRNGAPPGLIAVHFGLSLIITKEKLLIAENKGLLCRDESIRGLHFYVNKFAFQ